MNRSEETMQFDIDWIKIPVKIGDRNYVLKEADNESATRYRNRLMECATLGTGGMTTKVKGMAEVEPLLVSLCLYEVSDQGKETRVSIAEVKSFKAKTVKALYAKAKEISELDEEEETAESIDEQISELQDRKEKLQEDAVGNE